MLLLNNKFIIVVIYIMEHSSPELPVAIMFISSLILGYFINETLPLTKNITNNEHKLYMSLLMAFEMTIVELSMYIYFTKSYDFKIIMMMIIFICGLLFVGYKLKTLNFLDDKQYMLAMIEHHENAIAMSNAHDKYYVTNNPRLANLINNIKKTQNEEINLMKDILNK